MPKVEIYNDEMYTSVLYDASPQDQSPPPYHLPIEVSEEDWAEYNAKKDAFREVKDRLIAKYGYSEVNPYYEEQFMAWLDEVTPEIEPLPEPDEDPWAEYR